MLGYLCVFCWQLPTNLWTYLRNKFSNIKNASLLGINLQKFTGYDCGIDFYTFKAEFEKLVLPGVNAKLYCEFTYFLLLLCDRIQVSEPIQGVYRTLKTLKTLKNPEISGGDPENPESPEKPSFHVVKTLKIVFFPIKKITGLKI